MALGRPQRSASDDLKCPQMTSILLGARDEKFGQNPSYGHRSQIFGFYCIFFTKYFTK